MRRDDGWFGVLLAALLFLTLVFSIRSYHQKALDQSAVLYRECLQVQRDYRAEGRERYSVPPCFVR